MEESSEKRRERLQAMRMEASSQSQSLSSFSVQNLSNPLINSAADERTPQPTRFDFYTDPMAAFSGSKRRNPSVGGNSPYCSPETFSSPIRSNSPLSYPLNRPSAGPRNYNVASTHPPPSLQFQTNQPPDQSPWRSPMQFASPLSGHIGGTPPSYTPNRNSNRSGGGSPGYGFPPNYSSRGGGIQSPNFRHGSSPSPHSNSGRGNGWQFRGSGSSPRPGRGGGRGRGGFHDRCSARYDLQHQLKAMVKDPWRKLKPIVWNMPIPRSGSGSWLPKSIAAPKRAKVVESGARSQLSLAESLALAMEEAVNDA